MIANKRFLDSSVVQPVLFGSNKYKQYFATQFGKDKLYVSEYVKMEIKRSYLCPLIHFYFVLDMPNIDSVGDAFKLWSNRFKGSEIKAVMRLVGEMMDTRQLDLSDPQNKGQALRYIGTYIKRVESNLRRNFKDIGSNATRCARAKVPFTSSQLSLTNQLQAFITQFDDVKHCRSQCRVDDFVLTRFRNEAEAYINYKTNLPKPKAKENKGFVEIAKSLEKIINTKGKACSCRMCGEIGDAVIALETLRNMQLEHTDHSFDHLCQVINQPHYKHPSETNVVNS